jgi:hypothetical protein
LLGNSDGIATKEEIMNVDSFYSKNETGLAIGIRYFNFNNTILQDTIKKYLYIFAPLCKDKREQRMHIKDQV